MSPAERTPGPSEHQYQGSGGMAPGTQRGVGYQMPLFNWLWAGHVGAGLLNLGNTCYANAALQCLTYTPPLASYLLARADRPFCRSRPLCALCALQTHVQHTLLHPGAAVSPVKELLDGFHAHRQEDAHEFLMFTLDAMQRPCPQGPECMPGQSGDCDLVKRLFGGLWSSQLCCLRCRRVSTTLEPYLDVVLDIHTTDSVERALEALAETETLDGDNAYHCEACVDMGPASKTMALQEPSQVLVLVLKRFCGLTGRKVDKPVLYPPQLDLGMLVRQPEAGPLPYVLHAVLVHEGSGCHQGHYFCFIRVSPDCWFRIDDADVTACDASTALSQEAYMLFYARQRESELCGASGPVTTAETPSQLASAGAGLAPEIPLWEHPVSCHPMAPEPERAAPTLTLDQWRERQERERPKVAFNMRVVDRSLPTDAIVIHQGRGVTITGMGLVQCTIRENPAQGPARGGRVPAGGGERPRGRKGKPRKAQRILLAS